jgi:uncharacterized oxidoreductase
MNLSKNTILITGGAAGIGFELARQLCRRGNKVIITGRDQAKLDSALTQLPDVTIIKSDAGEIRDIETLHQRIVRDFPELNVLINNAGIMRDINFHKDERSLEDLTREIEINLCGPIRLTKKFLPQLKARPEAAIVNVSSGLAFVPLPISPIYCATKAALHSFTQSLRVQLKNTKVKVFELAPPATDTPLLRHGNPSDLKGVSIMSVEAMVTAAMKGFEKDNFEIRPGQANQLKFMSRLAPEFILKQLSRSVDRMLAS